MTRTFIGHKPGVGGVLKVMANDLDDPITTPNTDYSKFIFNSETGKLGYIFNTFSGTPDNVPRESNRLPGYSYLIEGNSFAEAEVVLHARTESYANPAPVGSKTRFLNLTKKFGFAFPPIFEARAISSTGRFTKQADAYAEQYVGVLFSGNLSYTHSLGGILAIKNADINGYETQQISRELYSFARWSEHTQYAANTNRPGVKIGAVDDSWAVTGPDVSGVSGLYTVWDLPANNTPIQEAEAYTPGLKMVEISPSSVKISLPGFDINDPSRYKKIIDSDRVPAKIIKAGEIFVPGNGNATVATPLDFPLTGNVYVDYIGWVTGEPLYIPYYKKSFSDWSNSDIVIEYTIQTNSITFYNIRPTGLNLRYIVIADDDAPPSSGVTKVIETNTSFTRILRPGANTSNPTWSDILFDSRLPYVPLLAEGYEAVSSFTQNIDFSDYLGTLKKTVSFTNGGLKPFAKVSVVYDDGRTYAPAVRLSIANGTTPTVLFLKQSGLVELTDTSVTFRCNPSGYSSRTITSNGYVLATDGPAPIGFRYYIFGLPI